MFRRKKKEVNVTTTTLSLVLGALFGFVYALLSTKQSGTELKKDIKKKADKAIKDSKRKLGREFVRAKKEIGAEFEGQLTKTFQDLRGKSKDWLKTLAK